MKIQITENQLLQFNQMRDTLNRIAKSYEKAEKLLYTDHKDGEERLMYAYDNIQGEAFAAARGVRALKRPENVVVKTEIPSDGKL